jgi:tRNA A37 threonylcarbamoyladenosine dehydratase
MTTLSPSPAPAGGTTPGEDPPAWQERTALLVGKDAVAKFASAHVLVVGLGGVGSWAAEFLVRAGIGRLTLVDGDVITPGNRNRQLPALVGTVGCPKTEVMAARLREINPEVRLAILTEYLRDDRLREVLTMADYDHVVDAIDALSQKVFLLAICRERGLPVVSSMGSGGKLDPTQIRVADLAESNHCPLARMVRKRLHRLGIRDGIPVVYSPEPVQGGILHLTDDSGKDRTVVGTIACVPAAFGAACASVVLRGLLAARPESPAAGAA